MADSSTFPVPAAVGSTSAGINAPWWALYAIAALILLIYAGTIIAVCALDNDTLRTSTIGSVPVVVMAAVNYFFGSSAGSAKKDDQNAAAISALAVSSPPAASGTSNA